MKQPKPKARKRARGRAFAKAHAAKIRARRRAIRHACLLVSPLSTSFLLVFGFLWLFPPFGGAQYGRMITDSSSKVARRLAFFGDLGTHFAFSPKVAEGRMPLRQRAILARLAWLGYVCVYMAGFLLRCRISSIPSPQMGSAAIGARGEVRGSIAANSFRRFIEGPPRVMSLDCRSASAANAIPPAGCFRRETNRMRTDEAGRKYF